MGGIQQLPVKVLEHQGPPKRSLTWIYNLERWLCLKEQTSQSWLLIPVVPPLPPHCSSAASQVLRNALGQVEVHRAAPKSSLGVKGQRETHFPFFNPGPSDTGQSITMGSNSPRLGALGGRGFAHCRAS